MVDFDIDKDIDKRKIDDDNRFFVTVSFTNKAIFDDREEAWKHADYIESYLETIDENLENLGEEGEKSVQCTYVNEDGERCQRMTKHPSSLCWQHR